MMRAPSGRLYFSAGIAFLACAAVLPGRAFAQVNPPPVIAYEVPAGTVGNQNYGGSLGMDFDVNLDIVVTRLGVFDSESNGLQRPLNARLFDRDQLTELALIPFTTEDPGELIGGSRFKTLETPIELPAGFHGTISADGYGVGEPNGNAGGVDMGLVTNDGGCSINFVGTGRFGDAAAPGSFPGSPDGGPQNRYASGTFLFQTTESMQPTGGIAFQVPDGTVGNQNFGGNLGMDFNANVAIKITHLGVFDSAQDGLLVPLTARVFHRVTEGELAMLEFTPEDQGDLEGGHRYKPLDPPLSIPAGSRCTIAASGYGDLEMNGNFGNLGQTYDNGSCAVSFVGAGRFGLDPAAFPPSRDNGPSNRYVSGSFLFEVDPAPPVPPPEPIDNLKLQAGDARIDLTWNASVGATPAATYKLFKADGLNGVYTQIAQVPEALYADTGLPNGVEVCYYVVAVSQDGRESLPSRRRCSAPVSPLPPGRFIAYEVPAGTRGNQNYTGALGMDFDVEADIRIHRVGVFDDGSDGLNLPITARVFERGTMTELAIVEFTPDDSGILIRGSRFKPLDPPLDLDAGFEGTMVASGYGGGESNGNQGVGPVAGLTTSTGDCRISFLGGGRFGNDPASFPGTPDGGPANRYAAGTFDFEGRGAPFTRIPGIPSVTSTTGDGQVRLSWTPVPASECVLAAASYKVFRSQDGGPFTEIAQPAVTEHIDGGLSPASDYCYRVRAVAEGGVEGQDSLAVCETPGRFIAYKVPQGTTGAVIDGLIVGMDFDVQLGIRVHRLGIFDSGGDGLLVPLTVRLWDRDQGIEMDSLDFTPEEPGTLLGGSRFKTLRQPIDLTSGFRGSIAVEGYLLEEPCGAGGPWTTDQGPCSVNFVGRCRTGVDPGALPPDSAIGRAGGRADYFAAGTFQFESLEAPVPRGAVAYLIPEGTFGNQNFGGQLGMDFNVNVPISVIRLGVFDSAGDGMNADITAILYDRVTRAEMSRLLFTFDDPGDLEGGSRFKALEFPVALPAGFQGTMAAVGYNAVEQNGNAGGVDLGLLTDDGGCAISFLGGGRFGDPAAPDTFPVNLDGGPPNRYAAGTFEFEAETVVPVARFRRGDTDSNGNLELTDAIVVLNYLFLGAETPDCLDAADTDDSGELDITDAVNNLNYQFLGAAEPPAPGPNTCGEDPSKGDPLDCKAECR